MAHCAFKNQKLILCRTFYQNWLEDLEDGLPYETGYFPNKNGFRKDFLQQTKSMYGDMEILRPKFLGLSKNKNSDGKEILEVFQDKLLGFWRKFSTRTREAS